MPFSFAAVTDLHGAELRAGDRRAAAVVWLISDAPSAELALGRAGVVSARVVERSRWTAQALICAASQGGGSDSAGVKPG
jgi:hypothetical protein